MNMQTRHTEIAPSVFLSTRRGSFFFISFFFYICLFAFNASCLFLSMQRGSVSGRDQIERQWQSCGSLPRIARNDTSCILRSKDAQTWIAIALPRNGIKTYRRTELSRISPSVICGLSHSGEDPLWFGMVSRPICISLPIFLSRQCNSGLRQPIQQ